MVPGDVDLLNVNLFAESREYAVFPKLRAEAPVYFHPGVDAPGFYTVTRYVDAVGAVRNYALSASDSGQIVNRKSEGYGASSVHNGDLSHHTYLRNVVLPSFAPPAPQRIEPKVRETVNLLFDECPRGADFDFVDSFAALASACRHTTSVDTCVFPLSETEGG